MKKFSFLLLLVASFSLYNCDTDDAGFYNNVTVDIPNLVKINPHSNAYLVGEKIFVNATFSRYLKTSDKQEKIDLYKTTGADKFAFSYVIEKLSAASVYETVSVADSQLTILKGDAVNNPYVYGICKYNDANQQYEYFVGFPLLSKGTYRLSYGYNSNSLNNVELRSLSPEKRLILNINSASNDINSGGFYNFTVN